MSKHKTCKSGKHAWVYVNIKHSVSVHGSAWVEMFCTKCGGYLTRDINWLTPDEVNAELKILGEE